MKKLEIGKSYAFYNELTNDMYIVHVRRFYISVDSGYYGLYFINEETLSDESKGWILLGELNE